MATQYQTFTVPPGFPGLLKDFTREVLRAQVRTRARPLNGPIGHCWRPGDW